MADPFLVPGTDGRVLLCERFDYGKGRGVIERVERDGDDHSATTPVIDDPLHHLSYPFLYRNRGRLYCVPERASSGDLVAFHLSNDATQVLGEKVLMRGVQAIDPTLVRYRDRWWLFCTLVSEGLQSHLFVFHAPVPDGPWQAHLQNPVVVDIGSARPAGQPFMLDDQLVRPGQDGSLRYGGGVGLYRIEVMTPSDYRETRIGSVDPTPGTPAADGLHHISFDDGWVAIDGYVARSSISALIDKARRQFARSKSGADA